MNTIKKASVLLLSLCAVFALTALPSAAADGTQIDPILILSTETNLTVSVDGEISVSLSGEHPYGETVSITAPAVAEKTFLYWTNGSGEIISYAQTLTLTMYAHTTVNAVYGDEAATAADLAAFTSISRYGDAIAFCGIGRAASGAVTDSGVLYSTTAKTLTALKKLTPDEAIERSGDCWTLLVTPEDESATYYAVAYAVVGDETCYSSVKTVKLSELASGVSLVANLGDITLPPNIDPSDYFCNVSFAPNGGEGVMTPQGLVKNEATALKANAFTREGYVFSGWSTNETGGGTTYKDGETVTLSEDLTLYAQWRSGGSGGGGGNPINVFAPGSAENGTVTVSPQSATQGKTITITVTPDEGYETSAVTVTDAKGNAVPVTKNADGTYSFTMPATEVTVDAVFAKVEEQPPVDDGSCPKDATCPISKFTDAKPDAWYHDGVHWALVEDVMKGTSDTTFEPNGSATRAMVVTMLWRLEGEPAASGTSSFTDVSSGAWYEQAVNWASENGVVKGTSETTFSPSASVTREQLAAILYRYAQSKGEGFTGAWAFPLNFPDAASVSEYANEAMCWMTMKGIITGMGDGTLAPQDNATRAQIATMFMRFCGEMEQ